MEQYLLKQPVHRDFHHVLSLIVDYLKDTYGENEAVKIIEKLALEVYKPLIKDLREKGLSSIEKHIVDVMKLEGGEYDIVKDANSITINVEKCPAIDYMRNKKMEISENFCCFSTGLVSKVIAESAGYKFSLDYDLPKGKCIQKFWKE